MKKAIIKGICCKGCSKDVKHILESIYGISNVTVAEEDCSATFDGFVSKEVIEAALNAHGYEVVEIIKL